MTRGLCLLCLCIGLAAPPPARAADGEITRHTLHVGGVERVFWLYVPPAYDGQTPFPVLLMFHGLNSDAEFAASPFYNWQATADANGFLVLFPDSLTPPPKDIVIGGRVIVSGYDGVGKRWDIGHILNGRALPGYAGRSRCESSDLAFVGALLDWLEAHFAVQTDRIFATGHSYGGYFSYYAALCLPGRIAAFGEHSAGLITDFIPGEDEAWPLPVPPASVARRPGILIHSTDDPLAPYPFSVALDATLRAQGHPAQLITLTQWSHYWNPAHNQTQWDFFMAHTAPLSRAAFLPLQWVGPPPASPATPHHAIPLVGTPLCNPAYPS